MSVFETQNVTCPACGSAIEFEVSHSVNADRRPDLRDEIVEGSFQSEPCPSCESSFRLDPELTYLDVGRHQWIAAFPASRIGDWPALEEQARTAFASAYGDNAPPAASAIGHDLAPRLTFGWAALREKLLIQELGLDDRALELLKIALLRGLEEVPVGGDMEMRLVDQDGDKLVIAWLHSADEKVEEMMAVPKDLYEEIGGAEGDWDALRQDVSAGLFVDLRRLTAATA